MICINIEFNASLHPHLYMEKWMIKVLREASVLKPQSHLKES